MGLSISYEKRQASTAEAIIAEDYLARECLEKSITCHEREHVWYRERLSLIGKDPIRID